MGPTRHDRKRPLGWFLPVERKWSCNQVSQWRHFPSLVSSSNLSYEVLTSSEFVLTLKSFRINPAIKDWSESKSYAGDAKHTYGNEFKCWAEHGHAAFTLADGKTCTSAYICYHPPDNPPPAAKKTKTDYAMSKKDVTVRVQGTNAEIEAWKPQNAFRHINDDDEGIQCAGTSYQIGSVCKLRFNDCWFSSRDHVDGMKKILIDAIAPAVAKTRVTKKGHYNGKCPPGGGPCEPGYDFE